MAKPETQLPTSLYLSHCLSDFLHVCVFVFLCVFVFDSDYTLPAPQRTFCDTLYVRIMKYSKIIFNSSKINPSMIFNHPLLCAIKQSICRVTRPELLRPELSVKHVLTFSCEPKPPFLKPSPKKVSKHSLKKLRGRVLLLMHSLADGWSNGD